MKFQSRVKNLVETLNNSKAVIEGIAAQVLLGEMSFRIFTRGKDQKGNYIGKYSVNYAKYREEKGLQTSYVDLTFSTELLKSIVQQDNKVLFKNAYGIEIAKKNERHFKKVIFKYSEAEKKKAIDVIQEEVSLLIKKNNEVR